MTPLDEDALVERLRQTAESFTPPPALTATIMDSVSASQRHNRARSIALLAVAACVAAALVIGVSVISGRVQSAPPADRGTPSPSPSESPSPDKPTEQEERQANRISYRWARDLPRGADAQVVFAHDGLLYAGEERIPLPPTVRVNENVIIEASVSAAVPDGWVVTARDADDPSRSEAGILSPDGTFRPFVHQYNGKTDRGCVAVSPDQRSLVLGMDLVALPDGEQIGEVFPNSRYCQVWTDYGLIYPDRKDQMWIWDVGQRARPQPLPDEARSIRSDGYGIDYEKGCTGIIRLQPNAKIETVTELCGVRGSSLSPTADKVLTDNYEVYDTRTQRLVQSLNVPDELRGYLDTPVWEGTDSLVFNVTNWDWYRQNGQILNDGFIVRCYTTTGECERASQKFSGDGAPQVVMPLDASNPYWF